MTILFKSDQLDRLEAAYTENLRMKATRTSVEALSDITAKERAAHEFPYKKRRYSPSSDDSYPLVYS
jgi:hypothetical protein